MMRFEFSTTYLGSPESALQLLMEPSLLAGKLPYIRRAEVLNRPFPDKTVCSWEIEIDGAVFTWREECQVSEDRRIVRFRMIRGDFTSYLGEWLIQPRHEHTVLTLRAELDWGAPNLSRFVGQILEKKADRALRGMVLMIGRLAQQRSFEASHAVQRFGFIFHPLDLGLFADGFEDEDLKMKRPALLAKVMTWLPPFRRGVISGIQSREGTEITGDMLLMTLLPEQMLSMDDEFVLARLVDAGRLGERYGDKIIGLGAYAANIGRKGLHIGRNIGVPVTTGSSYTIAVAYEAILKACESVGINLAESNVAIIGATGTIGSICAHLLAARAGRLTLAARNPQRLEDLAEALAEKSPVKVVCLTDLDAAVAGADVIIAATNSPETIINLSRVKPGAVICDVSRPHNVSEEVTLVRPDVLVIDGGVVRPPGEMATDFSFGLAPGLAYACMAETMILTMEGKYESFSLGGNVDAGKVEEIARLGKKHGFTLASMRSYEKEVSEQQVDLVRTARKKGSSVRSAT